MIRHQRIDRAVGQRRLQGIAGRGQQAFAALNERAQAQGIAILRTPMGFAMAPARDGKVVEPAAFNAWPEAEREAVEWFVRWLKP